MTTLKDLIHEKQQEISKQEKHLTALRDELNSLFTQRLQCKHEFTPPFRNYEHEGGYCKLCGMNEVFYDHMRLTNKNRAV